MVVTGYLIDVRDKFSNKLGNIIDMGLHLPEVIRAYRTGLNLTKLFGRTTLVYEWKEWKKYYIPFDLTGKTIIDIGAGEGETAYFFFKHGAKKVIAIECDDKRFSHLEKNAKKFNWNIELHHKKFNPEDMMIFEVETGYDLCKIDIEGYEGLLLECPILFENIILEVHNGYLREQFEKIGYRRISPKTPDLLGSCIMTNISD